MGEPTRQHHILLAEDSDSDVGIVRLALQDQGINHVLHLARDGEEAINFIQKADDGLQAGIDLLLLDMHLPKYNGKEILERLRSTKLHVQIPVVVMTSFDATQDPDRTEVRAAVFYFQKPSSVDGIAQLGAFVSAILNGEKPLALGAAQARNGG